MVTPERVIAFVERKLGTNPAIRGIRDRRGDVDEFVVFQRLREIDVLFDGLLNDRYRLTRVAGRVSNGWLDCRISWWSGRPRPNTRASERGRTATAEIRPRASSRTVGRTECLRALHNCRDRRDVITNVSMPLADLKSRIIFLVYPHQSGTDKEVNP